MANITRLYYEIIRDIPTALPELDRALVDITGYGLLGLAARAVGTPVEEAKELIGNYNAAVVPVSSGDGVIPGFDKAVHAILKHIGLTSFITDKNDIEGIGEAFTSKADIFFAADDNKFFAFNLKTLNIADNSRATAIGFVHALAAAAESMSSASALAGQTVLVIGLGPVGSYAANELIKLGSQVFVSDTDVLKLQKFSESNENVKPIYDLRKVGSKINYILDATPSPGFIDENIINQKTIIACPGVPHGLSEVALKKIGNRFIHDVLPLGVATMALQSIFGSGN